jgi:hypothetical protein
MTSPPAIPYRLRDPMPSPLEKRFAQNSEAAHRGCSGPPGCDVDMLKCFNSTSPCSDGVGLFNDYFDDRC